MFGAEVILQIALALIQIGIVSVIIALIENKFHIINRIKKSWAILLNKETSARLALEYETKLSFSDIITEIKKRFRGEPSFRIVKQTNIRMDIIYDAFSIKLIQNQDNNVFLEVERISCGIKDLRAKINKLLGKLNELSGKGLGKQILSGFLTCDLSFSLPYKWDDLNMWTPKGLEIKKYNVSFTDKDYKSSEVEVSLNKVSIKTDAREAVLSIINKFV
jgi:hypothetical protein